MSTANFLGTPKIQLFADNGDFLEGGKIYSYVAGTTTRTATYPTIADGEASTNPNANPVILNARGEANIVIASPTKLVCYDSNDELLWSADNLGVSTNDVYDGSGNLIVAFSSVLNAVNWVDIQNNTTGNAPILSADGAASNIDLKIAAKGSSGTVQLVSGGVTFLWPTTDGSNNQLLTTDGAGQLSFRSETLTYSHPAGIVSYTAASSAPTGWLLCDGSAVSRTTYATLFAAIAITFGAGDGTTTFNIPDIRRRVIVGAGGSGTATLANTVGSIGGEESHTLTVAEIPSHSHAYLLKSPNASNAANSGGGSYALSGASTSSTYSTGGGSAHNNLQPSIVLSAIIKT